MRSKLNFVVFAVLCAASLASCGGGVQLNDNLNGTTVRLKAGDPVTVTLRSLGDSGYSNWVVSAAPDPAVLKSTGSKHQEGGGLSGDFGQDVFSFEAVAAGETSIQASASRFSGEEAHWVAYVHVQ
jgi:predicted secreted protein